MSPEEALRKILDRRQRQSDSYRSGVEYPTEYSRAWHDGYTTAMAECSLLASEALDPAGWAEHEHVWKVSSYGTDREWFELTGNCGHCGMAAEDCACTDDDPCQCGPHPERRTWPRDCFNCKGTGKIEPTRRAALAPVGDPNG